MTTSPDFRALCAAGADSLDAATDPDDLGIRASQWIAEARAALAVPMAADSDVIRALVKAEAALADIGDAEREPGDDLAWCERRAAEALPFVRDILAMVTKPEAQP